MSFDMYIMPNGLRVIGERIPWAGSVAIGLYIGVGSQYEPVKLNGISHFIEHMVFKGTQKRSAKQIAIEMDRIGGQINAYTAKESTCFYTRTLPRFLNEAMDVVFDLTLDPAFDPGEMEKEKGVVLEEIAMAEDDPEDLVHELLMAAHFGKQPIARPILGTEKRVRSFSRDNIANFHNCHYRPNNAVFSVAGEYDWQEVLALLERYTGEWKPADLHINKAETEIPVFSDISRSRRIEQTHLCLGFPGTPISDIHNYDLSVISTVYGGAMSSRLFQHIREDLGMAYSVYSELGDYVDCGLMTVYAAVNPENVLPVYDEIMKLTREFAEKGMTRDEFEMARDQLTAEIILGGESVSSHMQSNGRRLLLLNETRTEEGILERLRSLELGKVNELLAYTLSSKHSTAVVGKNAKETISAIREK